jgi:hypothetical protein
MPKLSISSSSLAFLDSFGNVGIAIGQTAYTCAARIGTSSFTWVETIASKLARGKPSPRVLEKVK